MTLTAIKERPILFSGPMVQAILQGRKTQARRVIKGSINEFHVDRLLADWALSGLVGCEEGEACFNLQDSVDSFTTERIKCSYGKPGDRLWVRETWRLAGWDEDFVEASIEYKAGGGHRVCKTEDLWEDPDDKWSSLSDSLNKKGVLHDGNGHFVWDDEPSPLPWNPSIFMPRAASRILLEAKNVRVERLHEITAADCLAEGIQIERDADTPCGEAEAFNKMASLWDSINFKRGYGWDLNPWVWVVEFRRVAP